MTRWLKKVQPYCSFCGWRWRFWFIEFDYQCDIHWDDGETYR